MKKIINNENKGKASFFKRLEAYVLDILFCGLITAGIFGLLDYVFEFKDVKTQEYNEQMNVLVEEYEEIRGDFSDFASDEKNDEKSDEKTDEVIDENNGEEEAKEKEELTEEDLIAKSEEYINKVNALNEKYYRDLFLEDVPRSLISLVVGLLYFSLFAYYNKGQTLFKKFFNIRVVNKEGFYPTFMQLLVRSVIFSGYYATACNLILVFFMKNDFYAVSNTLSTISSTIMLISAVLVLFDKEKKGLHDLIAGTSVVVDENSVEK